MSRRLPLSGSDGNVVNGQFGYSAEVGDTKLENNIPVSVGDTKFDNDIPVSVGKRRGVREMFENLLVYSGIYSREWTSKEIEINDKWLDWFARYRIYILLSIGASVITLVVVLALYVGLFAPIGRISSFDLKHRVRVLDLGNQGFRGWLKTVDWVEIGKSDLERGVIRSPVFVNSGFLNVTVQDLKELLEFNCPLAGRECLCLSMFHLGFAANSIILNDFRENTSTFLIEPSVTSQSTQTIKIRIGKSKNLVEFPQFISIEYLLESGLKTRRTLENEYAACILECFKEKELIV